jgi:VanZ family protein
VERLEPTRRLCNASASWAERPSSDRVTNSPSSSSRLRGFLFQVLPALVYVAVIFCAGSLRATKLPQVNVPDKLVHLIAFGILQLLAYRAVRFEQPRKSVEMHLWTSAISTSAVGALLEIYQLFIKYRSAELLDWVADTVGAAPVALLIRVVVRRPIPSVGAEVPERDSTSTAS